MKPRSKIRTKGILCRPSREVRPKGFAFADTGESEEPVGLRIQGTDYHKLANQIAPHRVAVRLSACSIH